MSTAGLTISHPDYLVPPVGPGRLSGAYNVTDAVYVRSDSFRGYEERPYSSVFVEGIPFLISKVEQRTKLPAASVVARN